MQVSKISRSMLAESLDPTKKVTYTGNLERKELK